MAACRSPATTSPPRWRWCSICRRRRLRGAASRAAASTPSRGAVQVLLFLASLKIAGALLLWGAAQSGTPAPYPHPFPPWYHLLFLAVFAGTGAALLWIAR